MRRKVNVVALVILVTGFALLVTGGYFLHRHQVQRNASALLSRADAAQQDDELAREIDYLRQYLGFEPSNTEVLVRYGLLLANERVATTPVARLRAMTVLDQALLREPDRTAVRLKVVELAMSIGRYREARDHLTDHLVPASPRDPALLALRGRCHDEMGEHKAARADYEAAVSQPGASSDTYYRLAYLLRAHGAEVAKDEAERNNLPAEADKLIHERMIPRDSKGEETSRDYRAYLTRADYVRLFRADLQLDERGRLIEADVKKAHSLAGDHPDVVLALADLAVSRNELTQARDLLASGVNKNPKSVRLRLAQAELEAQTGQLPRASELLRTGLKEMPGQIELLWSLADVLLRRGENLEAREAVAQLRRGGAGVPEVRVLDARLAINEKKWKEAADALQEAMSGLLAQMGRNRQNFTAALARQAGLMLGECQERQGKWGQAHDAYRQVLEAVDPRSLEAKTGMARARQRAGLVEEALAEYAGLARMSGAPAAALVEQARLAVQRQFVREQPNWAEAENVLLAAEQQLRPLPVEIVLLRLEVFSQQGRLEGAQDYLDGLVRRSLPMERPYNPLEQPAALQLPLFYYVAKAAVYDAAGQAAKARQALAHAEAAHGQSFVLRAARIQHLTRLKDDKGSRPALRALEDEANNSPPAERRQLLLNLATVYVRHGDPGEAKRIWLRVAQDWPDDVFSRLALFDLALMAQRTDDQARLIGELRKAEGEAGHLWRNADVRRLLAQADDEKGKGTIQETTLKAAAARLEELRKLRPNWSRVFLAEAQLADLRGQRATALARYEDAVSRGERGPEMLRRMFALYIVEGRNDKAQQVMRRLPSDGLTGVLGQVAAEVALERSDLSEAVQRAEKQAAGSKRAEDHVWLGGVYARAYGRDKSQRKKVEGAFREAINLNNKAPAAWTALVLYLVDLNELDDARKELAEAEKLVGTDKDAYLPLALAYEAVGDMAKAEENLKKALVTTKRSPAALNAMTMFLLRRGQIDPAKRLLVELQGRREAAPREADWARRLLAVLQAGGTYKDAQTTLAGLGNPLGLPANADAKAVGDQRARVFILARQPGRQNRAQAITLLADLIAQKKQVPADHLLLGSLYEKDGKWPLAARQYDLLAQQLRGAAAAEALVPLARGLINRDQLSDAGAALDRLEKAAPGLYLTSELRARLLHKEKKTADGLLVLEEAVAKRPKDLGVALAAAGAFESLGSKARAEQLYLRVVRESRSPAAVGVLVSFYARQKDAKKALALCDEAWKTAGPTEAADLSLLVLQALPDNKEVLAHLDARFTKAHKANPKAPALMAAVGHLRVVQGRKEEALALYEAALRAEPDKAVTLNNLAWLLSLNEATAPRALELTQQAIDQVGPAHWLLDTRAQAYLTLGKADEALKLLEEAIEEEPSATYRFHLAQAHHLLGDGAAAAAALKKALAEGLSLHPLERAALAKLKKDLGVM